MSITLAMSTEMAYNFGPEETMRKAKNLGFSSLELTPVMWDSHYNPVIPSKEKITYLKELLDKYELASPSVSVWYLPPTGTWREEKRFFPEGYTLPTANAVDYAQYLEELVHISPEFGIKVINFFIYPFMGRTNEDTLRNVVAGIRNALDAAEKQNVFLCMEQDVLCDLLRTMEGLHRIVKEINHPHFKMTCDPSNFHMVGIEVFPYAYSSLKKHIHHIHLRNSCVFQEGDPPDERFFPFTGRDVPQNEYCRFVGLRSGALNIYGLIQNLLDDNYNGILTLQPLNRDFNKLPLLLTEDMSFVQNILADKQQRRQKGLR